MTKPTVTSFSGPATIQIPVYLNSIIVDGKNHSPIAFLISFYDVS